MSLPTLYKKTSTGASQFWEIRVEGNTIITRWGQIDGKVQEARDVVKLGKNRGRANATTPAEQALSEATSLWDKKLQKGYVKDLSSALAGKIDSRIIGGIFPMLAEKYEEFKHKLMCPCYGQPKFDGHRCIAIIAEGVCTLWTRSRKPITSMGHIIKAFNEMKFNPRETYVFDGELYNHDYKENFEDLTSFIKDSKAKPGADVVQYHIYDMVTAQPFSMRTQNLKKIFTGCAHPLVLVETVFVPNLTELNIAYERFLEQGYEGAMARNANGLYVNKRSVDLLKMKTFMDEEFEIVAVEEGRGKLTGHGIFVCKTKDGETFKAKMKGDTAELKQYWTNPGLAIGRQLTVKFQGYTKKNNVPRFPVALRFRDD